MAPVNEPFSCPNNSLLTVPVGMAPQFTGSSFLLFRKLKSWMMREKASLPTPLSPIISTGALVLATLTAVLMAKSSSGEFPTMLYRFLMAVKSMFWRDITAKVIIFAKIVIKNSPKYDFCKIMINFAGHILT